MRACVYVYVCVYVLSPNYCRVHSNLLIHYAKMADCCTRDCNSITRQMTLDDISSLAMERKLYEYIQPNYSN